MRPEDIDALDAAIRLYHPELQGKRTHAGEILAAYKKATLACEFCGFSSTYTACGRFEGRGCGASQNSHTIDRLARGPHPVHDKTEEDEHG